MQDASGKEIKLDDKYVVNDEIELEKEPLVLFFQSKNYSGKNGFSLKKVEYSETADYKNPKEIPIDEKSKFYEEEAKRYKVTIPLDSMQEGKSYYFMLSFAADSGQGRTVRFCIKIKKTVVVEKPKSKEPTITAISANPPSATPGDEVTLEVKAESPDGGTLSYQWYAVKNNAKEIIEGGNKSRISYTIPSDASDGVTLIFCVKVTNTVQGREPAEKTSDKVTVAIKKFGAKAPTVSVSQTEFKLSPGEKIELSVNASSPDEGEISYKWEEFDGNKYFILDNASFRFHIVTMPTDEGWGMKKYRVTVTNTIILPDGTKDSTSISYEFTITEDVRKPMPAPVINEDGTYIALSEDDETVLYIDNYNKQNGINDTIDSIRRNLTRQFLGTYDTGSADIPYFAFFSGEKIEFTVSADDNDPTNPYQYRWYIGESKIENESSVMEWTMPDTAQHQFYVRCIVVNPGRDGKRDGETTYESTIYRYDTGNQIFFEFNSGAGTFLSDKKNTKSLVFPLKRVHYLVQDADGTIETSTYRGYTSNKHELFIEGEFFQEFLKQNGLSLDTHSELVAINDNYNFEGWDINSFIGSILENVTSVRWQYYNSKEKPFKMCAKWKILNKSEEDAKVCKVFYTKAWDNAFISASVECHPHKIEWNEKGQIDRLHFQYTVKTEEIKQEWGGKYLYYTYTYYDGESFVTKNRDFNMNYYDEFYVCEIGCYQFKGDADKEYYKGDYQSDFFYFYPHGTDVSERGQDVRTGGVAKCDSEVKPYNLFDNTKNHAPGDWYMKIETNTSYVCEYVISIDHEEKTQTMESFKFINQKTERPNEFKFIPHYKIDIDTSAIHAYYVDTDEVSSVFGSVTKNTFVDYDAEKVYIKLNSYARNYTKDSKDKEVRMYLRANANPNISVKGVSDDGKSGQENEENTVGFYSFTPPAGQDYTVVKVNGEPVTAELSTKEFYEKKFDIGDYWNVAYNLKVRLEGIDEQSKNYNLYMDACISELPITFKFSLIKN